MGQVAPIPQQSPVSVKLYNIDGGLVSTIENGVYSAGYQRISFDAKNLASGVYFLNVSVPVGKLNSFRKVVLVK